MLDGMFSFVLVDNRDNSFIAARDPIGITPLYLGWGSDGKAHITQSFQQLLAFSQFNGQLLSKMNVC